MDLETIGSEKELLIKLNQDVIDSQKKEIIMITGHFPLLFLNEQAFEGIHQWCDFSTYSLELACKLASNLKEKKVQTKFLFLVDDHTYAQGISQLQKNVKTPRKKLYQIRSGESAELPKEFQEIMNSYNYSEKDVIRQNQGKFGRTSCLYFSENNLRNNSPKVVDKQRNENICAEEIINIINNNQFSKEKNYLIIFVPNRCKNNICHVATNNISGINISNIVMKSAPKKDIFDCVVQYQQIIG